MTATKSEWDSTNIIKKVPTQRQQEQPEKQPEKQPVKQQINVVSKIDQNKTSKVNPYDVFSDFDENDMAGNSDEDVDISDYSEYQSQSSDEEN